MQSVPLEPFEQVYVRISSVRGHSNFQMCTTVRTVEEKVLKERKTNLLVVVREFLAEEGYIDTLKCFENESRLSKDYALCDNVDLGTILEEFESYYFVRFKKYPKITKKVKNVDYGKPQEKRKIVKQRSEPSGLCFDRSAEKCTEQPVSNDYLKVESCGAKGDHSRTSEENHTLKLWKSLGSYEGYSDEWKTFAGVIAREVIDRDLNVKWEDIAGLEAPKQHLREAIVYPMKYPELFRGIMSPWKSLLLYGPSGTGKTLLAKAVATECNTTFFNISASSLMSKWRGDSEKLVRVMFELAQHQAPSTIFIDELDALASKRDCPTEHEASRRSKSEFLVQLDGLANSGENVFLLTTSNLPWDLDPAILRRLEKKIFVGVPSDVARTALFESFLPKHVNKYLETNANYSRLAANSEGYSGAEIKLVCKEALMIATRTIITQLDKRETTRKIIDEPKKVFVTTDDVLDVIKRVQPVSNSRRFKAWLSE